MSNKTCKLVLAFLIVSAGIRYAAMKDDQYREKLNKAFVHAGLGSIKPLMAESAKKVEKDPKESDREALAMALGGKMTLSPSLIPTSLVRIGNFEFKELAGEGCKIQTIIDRPRLHEICDKAQKEYGKKNNSLQMLGIYRKFNLGTPLLNQQYERETVLGVLDRKDKCESLQEQRLVGLCEQIRQDIN